MRTEFKKLLRAAYLPTALLLLLWFLKAWEQLSGNSLHSHGINPRTIQGLQGILFSPLIHGDWMHLFDNSIPLFFLTTMLFYFYRAIAWESFAWIWLMSGLWTWIMARPSYHIGASSLIYGLAAFLFFSGVIRRNLNLMSLSLLVVALYGSLIWGLLPVLQHISWEGHMMGGLAGAICAFYYRKSGSEVDTPAPAPDEDDLDDNDPYWMEGYEPKPKENPPVIEIIYHLREKKEE